MNHRLAFLMLTAAVAGTACTQGVLRPPRQSLLVESPSDLPALGRQGGVDMFLHDTSRGRTYLYIESAAGQTLSILDVTDPAAIRSVGEVAISAPAAFDYVQDVNHQSALVRYRDRQGYAMLDFSRYDRPSLHQTAQLSEATAAEGIGDHGLLLTSGGSSPRPAASTVPGESHLTYAVMDASHGAAPALLASMPGVRRRLTKTDTDTVFVLADNGVTVVRNLRAEEDLALHVAAERQ